MTAKTTFDIKNDIIANFPDNIVKAITASVTRSELNDIADSYVNKTDSALQTVTGPVEFSSGITSGGNPVIFGLSQILYKESLVNQIPSATDTPLQINYGAASPGPTISIAASGKITYHVTGTYYYNCKYRIGRSASTGSAHLIIAYKLNGSWVSSFDAVYLDTLDDSSTINFSGFADMTSGDEVEVFLIRDSSGNNDGGLYFFDPVLSGVPTIPSASIDLKLLET